MMFQNETLMFQIGTANVSDRSLLEELSYKTNISNFIRVLTEGGSDTNHIIEQIAYEYPLSSLESY